MSYEVLLQRRPDGTYTATVLGWPDCVVEGETEDIVLNRIQTVIQERLSQGKIVRIEIEPPSAPHPWQRFAGMWQDDPTFEAFLAEMAAYRRRMAENTAE